MYRATSLPLLVEKTPVKSKKPKQFSKDNLAIFFAEFVGTAILVFLGCMGCINGVGEPKATHHMSSLSFGLVVMMIIQVREKSYFCCSLYDHIVVYHNPKNIASLIKIKSTKSNITSISF